MQAKVLSIYVLLNIFVEKLGKGGSDVAGKHP